jgi:hypothetical protein
VSDPKVTCPECDGSGIVEHYKQSSSYADSPDTYEAECESCGGVGAEACEYCGEPALAECSNMSKSYTGPGATVCSWTCKAMLLDGFVKVATAVDEQRRIVAIGRKHDASEFTKLLISVASGGRVQP